MNRFLMLALLSITCAFAGCVDGAAVERQSEIQQASSHTGPARAARTLLVSPTWSGVIASTTHYTTISAALTQAATLLPTQAAPVQIIVNTGSYSANLTLQSNVHITAPTLAAVDITGTVSYSPGTGVNAAFATLPETVNIKNLTLHGAVTINGTSKTSGVSTIVFRDSTLSGTITATGRSATGANRDQVYFLSDVLGAGATTFTDIHTAMFSTLYHGLTFNGACLFTLSGGAYAAGATDSTAVNGTSTGTVSGLNSHLAWSIASGASTTFIGSTFSGANGTLTVAAGGSANVRSSSIEPARLSGTGTVDRSGFGFTFGPTTGADAVTFAVPLPDAGYRVLLQLVNGPGNAGTYPSAKTGAGFTLNDSVGGNTYDVSIVRD